MGRVSKRPNKHPNAMVEHLTNEYMYDTIVVLFTECSPYPYLGYPV